MSIKQKSFGLMLIFLLPFLQGSSIRNGNYDNGRFSVSNYTVFTPGSDVSINLYSDSKNSETYGFRLFKITDPEKFFLGTDRSALSRNFDIWGTGKGTLLKFTKLVKAWTETVNASYYWGNNRNLKIGKINEPGTYILQALRNNQVAYCGISVSNFAMIYKSGENELLAYLVDSKSGSIIKDAYFKFYLDGKLAGEQQGNDDGLSIFTFSDSSSTQNMNPLLTAKVKGETVFSDPYFYIRPEYKNLVAYVYTNQPVYRPGQTVFFKAILREKLGTGYADVRNMEFTIKIKTPRGKEIFSKNIKTNNFGSLFDSLKLDDDADLGTYSIQLLKDGRYYFGSFDVEEYKKPEYLVTVKPDSSNYSSGDTIKAAVSAGYYFGSPVTGGKVSVKIFKQHFWRPWWYWSDYAWFYRSFESPRFFGYGDRELITEQTGRLNKEGKYNFEYIVPSGQSSDYNYIILADVTDNSRSTVSGSASVNVTRGSFTLSTSPDRYFVEAGTPVNLKVNASDFSDRPVETKFYLVVNYPEQQVMNKNSYRPPNDTLFGSTDKFGGAVVAYMPRSFFTGHYNYTVHAKDAKGREITAGNSFFIGTQRQYFYGFGETSPKIITDKDSYEKGDSLTAYIFIPDNNADVLITYESNDIIGYKVKRVKGNTLTIKEKLDEKFSPSFNLAVTYMKDGRLYTAGKLVGVLDKDKFLNVKINPSKEIYKPGDEAQYKIFVTRNNGRPAKNTELSFGIIDESIYAIKEDPAPDIKNFFYAPQYSYIPTYNSLQNNFSIGASRYATVLDKDIKPENVSPAGSGNLTGKILPRGSGINYSSIYILLSSDSFFYKTVVDTSGIYKFNNIKEGDYKLLVLFSDGEMVPEKDLTVGSLSMYDIDLGNYEIHLQNRFPIRAFGEDRIPRAGVMLQSAVTGNQALVKKEGAAVNGFVQPVIRSKFVDAIIWKPDIVTDENGEATVAFKMPDNLTTWRATVRGINAKTEVGQSVNKVITRKNLLIRVETPRFFREGDELTVSTIVHNYLNESKQVKISFKPKGLELINSKVNQAGYNAVLHSRNFNDYLVDVKKDSELRIDWNVKVTAATDSAKIIASALTREESDAVELKVPVLPYGIKKIIPLSADLAGLKEEKSIEFDIPKNVDLKSADLFVSSAPSLAGTILKALDDLAGYPYGCVEQTMSRFLPTIIVANTFKDLNAPLNAKTITELPLMAQAGLKRLYSFQHPDGGWGWWTNDQTNPYMTAYVIYGMGLAKRAGYDVDSSIYESGVRSLIYQLKNTGNINFTTQAYMLYSLSSAIKEDSLLSFSSLISALLKEKLNPYALSLLALTLNNLGEKDLLNTVLDKIEKSANEESSFAYWGGKAWHYSWQEDKVQTTAFAVKALLLNNKHRELITKAVRWLLVQKQGFSWRSTQETATVIFALSDYLKETKELNPDFNVTILLNNKKILERSYSAEDVYKNEPVISLNDLKENLLNKGKNTIRIIKSGTGKLYFSGRCEYFTKDLSPSADRNVFTVSRKYYLLEAENQGDKIIYVKHKFTGEITSGQYLLVKTHVECADNGLQYFILEDMLPSGFEAVKDEGNFQIADEDDFANYNDRVIGTWRWFYADKEYHDNKVSFFVTNVSNSMDFSYIIQAQIPGSYTVMPAQGYLMYYPEVSANTGHVEIRVEDAK